MNTDEGTGFLDDMTKKEVKHESDILLMNQLFDGKSDKMSLAKGNEQHVPANSTAYLYQYSHNLSVRLW